LQQLKLKLQQLGPLRPLAWEQLSGCIETASLQENENFIREEGTVAFLSTGLLKEYDARYRKKPSIVNFIRDEDFFLSRKNTQPHYIRACAPSMIYFIQWPSIEKVYQNFRELKAIYDGIASIYDHHIAYRQILLEERSSKARITIFIHANRHILPLLKKKDIANYLHMEYNSFVRLYSKLL